MPQPELPTTSRSCGFDFGAEDFGEIEDADQAFGLAMLVGDDGVAGLPVGAAVQPCLVILRLELGFVLQQFGEEGLGIGADGLLQVRLQLGELGSVDVDGDLVRFAGQVVRSVAGDGKVEADAESEQEIAVLQREVGAACGDGAGTADVGGIVGGNEIGGAPGGDGRHAEELAQLFKLFFRASEADAVAGEEQRPLGIR